MVKRIAIPVSGNLLAENAADCNVFQFVDLDGDVKEVRRFNQLYEQQDSLPAWLAEKGVSVLITHKIEKEIVHQFSVFKINLFIGVEIKDTELIISDFVEGVLHSDEKVINAILK